MKPNTLLCGLLLAVPSPALTQIPRPGIDCGCDRVGAYVLPARANVAWNALVSPRGTYQAKAFAGGNGVEIWRGEDSVLPFGPASGVIGWGFSPDERGLVIHMTEHNPPGVPSKHFTWLYNLQTPSTPAWQIQSPVSEAVSVFSPSGRYLLHVSRGPEGGMHLWAVEVSTLTEAWRHDYQAVSRPGEAGQRFGLAAWGFSPDPENASLTYLFNTESGVSLNLVNLRNRRRVINGWEQHSTTDVLFSPCGDLLGVVRYPTLAPAEVWLVWTLDGSHAVSGAGAAGFGYLEAQAGFHYAQTGSGAVQLLDNAAAVACVGIPSEAPYWPTGAKLTTTAVRATGLRLVRPTAQSQGGKITWYEIRQDSPAEQVLGTMTPKEASFTVQDLLPETEYRFSIRARNQAELWTAEALTVTVKTGRADAVPSWPLDAKLEADDLQENSLRLSWPPAVDDHAVTQYRVHQDAQIVATLGAQARGHVVSDLVIGRSYEFRVQAGDAVGQWSTDGPRLRLATKDLTPPSWPAGSRLYASERAKHHLVLEWTPAEDNVGVSLYSLYLVARGSTRLFTMVAGDRTNLTLNCLLPGQTLEFAVEAGDDAGNWSTGGPRGWASTLSGSPECQSALELASVNSAEQPTEGVLAMGWEDDGRYWYTADSESPAVSADGRFVAFHSIATNLVPNDRNNTRTVVYEGSGGSQYWYSDIFVRDRWAGTTERVNLRSGGGETAVPGSSHEADISGDGRYVVFRSSAADLVPGDHNGFMDIFLRDRLRRETRRLGKNSLGQEPDGHSGPPQISADGAVVVFSSQAENLVAHDDNRVADIFAVDVATGVTTRVSQASDGTQANAESWGASVSGDGRFVAFASAASNLVSEDTNRAGDVFVHDRTTGQTTRVSVSSTGEAGNGDSARGDAIWRVDTRPAISANGRFVAFDSIASNLVPNDANLARDVFVHDRETRQTTRVSLTSGGTEGPPAPISPGPLWAFSWGPDISGDGRFVVFLSKAALVPAKRTITADVFLHDRQTGETKRISACTCGGDTEPDYGGANSAAISQDGRIIAFGSESTNIKLGFIDPNWSQDILVFEHEPGPPDQDGDGTPDDEEQGPEGDDPLYDGDGDGVPDYLQDNVTVRHTLDGRLYLQSRVIGQSAAVRVTPVEPPDLNTLPAGVALPFGAFSIVAFNAVQPGGELLLELEFPEGVAFNTYYKYGGVTEAPEPRWYEFMYDGRSGAEIDGNRVTLHLVDGARGDHDLLADGNLVDPGGPALTGASPAPSLQVTPPGLLLVEKETTAPATLRNTGARPLVWAVTEALPAWLSMEPRRGELGPGEAVTVEARVDRSGLVPGVAHHRVSIHSGGGTRELAVQMEVPFALESGARRVGNCVVFTWRSDPGRAYRVQSADTLSLADWRDVSETVIATGASASWTDCRGIGPGRFYRVLKLE